MISTEASRVSTSAIARTSGKCRGGTWGAFASFGTGTEPSCQAGCSKPYCKPLAPPTDQSLELQSCKSRVNSQEENMKTTTSTLGILFFFFFFHAGGGKDGPGCVTQTLHHPRTAKPKPRDLQLWIHWKEFKLSEKNIPCHSVLSLMECSTTNKCFIEQILSNYGERMVCFTYICCAIPELSKSSINKVH